MNMTFRMRWNRVLFLAVFFSFFFAGPTLASDEKLIAAVIKDFPPFYQTSTDGKPEGFAIDILTALAHEAKLEISYLPVKNWGVAMQELRDGHADLIPGIGISPEREAEFIFSVHIETLPISWFIRKESNHIQTIEDLKDKKIAVLYKSAAADHLDSNPDFRLRYYDTLEEALFDLLAGNVDAFAFPKPVLEKKAWEIGMENRIRVIAQPLLELKRSYMYRASDEALRDRLDNHLKRFITSDEYLKVYNKWYGAPTPFWTTQKVFWAMMVFLTLVLTVMLMSRYASTRRLNRRIEESRKQLSALSSNLADSMVYQIDSGSDGKSRWFSYISPAVEKFHGVSVEAAKKDPGLIYGQVLTEDLERIANDEANAFEAKVKFEADVRVRMPSGDIRWRRFISSPRLTDEGNWLWDGIEVDITERKNLQAQLNQAQKMESIGRLAGGVAHDFNNMLGVIMGHVELATNEIDPTHPVWADLTEIKKAADRSANLTRQLLAFARKQTAVPRILDLNETIEGMLKMLRRIIGEDINLIWAPGKQQGLVNMDPSQVDQILANLCVNARDAIPDTGVITIRTRRTVLDETFCRDYPECIPGEYVLLSVSDTGTGMDRQVMEKLFEPFFTTKEVGKGTGLGLATVYGIIKQNNGLILVDSSPGQGSGFRIYLPLVEGPGPDREEIRISDTPSGGTETILLAEDDPAILAMSEKMLTNLGYTVLTASLPEEAIRTAKENTQKIDLLITDVIMPGMNGRDLAEALSSHSPDLKVLFMSGYTSDVISHHGVLGKGVYFIQKPFRIRELAGKVREILDQEKTD